ncbi:hypothetical protein RB195_001571 [Necator americanus]|uniref:EGF-like domain-containing protein n=1 Tax=Necator americanus TaxID=51031 RepID=A0ABR1DHW8_NECAM
MALQHRFESCRLRNCSIHIGDEGYCREGLCKNGGACVDKYDGYSCDCNHTPFGGSDCSKEYSMFVPSGSSLQIPWQNPAHTNNCHRISIQTTATNVSLVKSKALFADSTFNMSVNYAGYLTLSIYDGFFFTHKNTEKRWNLSDNIMHDIGFCASDTSFNLTVDGEPSIHFEGNWTFFQNFNVWTFLDKNYTGCVSRLQVGSSFPLKNPKAARLKHSGKIRFGSCSMDIIDIRQPAARIPDDEGIHIHAIAHAKHHIISVTSIAGLAIAGFLALLLSILVCYMRSRPEGVYKTNEGECSPSRMTSSCEDIDLSVPKETLL